MIIAFILTKENKLSNFRKISNLLKYTLSPFKIREKRHNNKNNAWQYLSVCEDNNLITEVAMQKAQAHLILGKI